MKLFVLRPGAFLVLVGLTVLGLLIYANAIFHPFVHDDVVFIQLNPNIARWDNIADAFCQPGVPFQNLKITTPYYRPVLEILYRAQYAVFGMHPSGFHFFNIILHIVNSWLIFWAIRFWGLRRLWAMAIAAFFLIHPVQSEAVACVSGVSNLAVAFLLLLSFIFYAKGSMSKGQSGVRSLMGAVLSFVIALFTKEQAVLLPVCLLAYELLRRRGRSILSAIGRLTVFFVMAGAYFVLRGRLFPDHLNMAFENWPELWLRVLAIPRIILMYWGLVVWPVGLHYYRSTDILSPPGWTWGVLAAIGITCGYAIARMPWRWKRPTVIGLVWGFLFLAPAFNIVPLINEYSFVFTAEHFIYLALGGFLVGGASLAGWLTENFFFKKCGPENGVWRRVSITFILIVAVVFGGLTVWQNTFWRGEVPLFERTLYFEPGLGRVHLLLARDYIIERRVMEAMSEYEKGLNIMKEYVKKSRNAKARIAYLQFVKGVYRDRGQIYMTLGDLARSSEEFHASIAIKVDGLDVKDTGVDDSQTANNLALNLLRLGRRSDACRWWQVAVKLNVHNADALNNLGMMALERKDKPAAIFYFMRALRAVPGFVPATQNLIKARRL